MSRGVESFKSDGCKRSSALSRSVGRDTDWNTFNFETKLIEERIIRDNSLAIARELQEGIYTFFDNVPYELYYD